MAPNFILGWPYGRDEADKMRMIVESPKTFPVDSVDGLHLKRNGYCRVRAFSGDLPENLRAIGTSFNNKPTHYLEATLQGTIPKDVLPLIYQGQKSNST